MSRTMLAILASLAVAFALVTGLAIHKGILGAPGDQAQQQPAIGGAFQLVDQSGRTVDQRALKGRWSAVFFGFTFCPEACPTTLLAMGQAEKLLGPTASELQTVFVSVDPARDTPKQLTAYLANPSFPKQVVGLTGTDAQVAGVAKAYHVFYQKAGEGPDYTINHSTITYLMNPRGEFTCVIPYGATPQVIAQKITTAMAAGPRAESC